MMVRNEIRIAPDPIVDLGDGQAIYTTIAAGEMDDGRAKDGAPRITRFNEGALVLVKDGSKVVLGPIEPQAALDLAIAVCKSRPLALTGSQHIHILAVGLLGFASCVAAPPEPAPPIASAEVA